MSLVLNMVGGGGVGDVETARPTDAILLVHAEPGSVVTISKGAISKTDYGHENENDSNWYDYSFYIKNTLFDSQNSWSVTATIDGSSVTKTIIIDSSDSYELTIEQPFSRSYQLVEYLEGTGTQYIRLPLTADNIRSGEVKFLITTFVSYSALFGSSPSPTDSGQAGTFGLFIPSWNNGFQYGGVRKNIGSFSTGTEYTLEYTVAAGSQTFVLNGVTTSGTASDSATSDPIYLFALGYDDLVKSAEIVKARIYEFKCYDRNGDSLVNLVPCYRKLDSVAGMYDLVSDVFYTNSGSGTFVVGGDVT